MEAQKQLGGCLRCDGVVCTCNDDDIFNIGELDGNNNALPQGNYSVDLKMSLDHYNWLCLASPRPMFIKVYF